MLRHRIVCLALLMGGAALARGQDIRAINVGSLVWTNANTQGVYSVEWASTPNGPWEQSWKTLDHQSIKSEITTSSVPIFFRILTYPVSMTWIVISNAHNAADSSGYGAVNYAYRIGKYEVDNAQYAYFLNSVDPEGTDGKSLYDLRMGSDNRGGITRYSGNPSGQKYLVRTNSYMQNKPVIYVSFWDACRFCNWLHNGQGSASTETGAYDLASIIPDNATVSRAPGARYFLPNEDEWYKAAYYDGGQKKYWLYPTRADTPPTIATAATNGDINNASDWLANYSRGADWNNMDGNVTTVGSGGASAQTPYGAADMAGNVDEWIENLFTTNSRCFRGGCWFDIADFLRSSCRNGSNPTNAFDSRGFRIAGPL